VHCLVLQSYDDPRPPRPLARADGGDSVVICGHVAILWIHLLLLNCCVFGGRLAATRSIIAAARPLHNCCDMTTAITWPNRSSYYSEYFFATRSLLAPQEATCKYCAPSISELTLSGRCFLRFVHGIFYESTRLTSSHYLNLSAHYSPKKATSFPDRGS